MDSMYEQLMGLPLFSGVSHQKISEIIGKYPFHFLKFSDGETIISHGEPCTHLLSVIAGEISTEIISSDGKFRSTQTLAAPDTISPEFLFGRSTLSPLTAVAKGAAGIVRIAKPDFLQILTSDSIFLFNYLNMLSLQAQMNVDGVMALTSGSLEKRIAFWILALTQPGGRDIVLQCRQRDMYAVFGVQRQSLVSALDHLASDDIISYDSREIHVFQHRKLVEILTE